jgi:lipoprotein-anchoring transpeptidase ErfK/SrfK
MKIPSLILAFSIGFVGTTSIQLLNPQGVNARTTVVQTKWDSRLDKVTTGKDNLIVWVDLKRQRASLFNKSTKKLITSYQIISGKKDYETPTGSFFINGNREFDPTGNNIELNGSYGSAYVQVWNPFIGNQIAFHNAPWRSPWEFGNTTNFINNGSHGCINMDPEDAPDLYKRTRNGTRVLVTN